MSSRIDQYFVLREGATQEEEWTWDEIAQRCRSGEFTAEAQVFLPDESRWTRVGDTDLESEFDGLLAGVEAEEEPGGAAAREALELEYETLGLRLEESPHSVELSAEAGSLAFELGRVDEARAHFGRALELHPFHPRVAQEVKRRFSRAECRAFTLLERPGAVWDNLVDIVAYPFLRGPLYVALLAVVFAGLLFVPGGSIVIAQLSLLWCYRCARAVAAGKTAPVPWSVALVNPLGNIVVPGVAVAAVFAEWMAVFWGIARLGIAIEDKAGVGVLAYIGASPVLMVALALCGLAYLPAVIVLFEANLRGVLRVINPLSVVKGAVRMRAEYVMSLALLFALVVVAGVVGALSEAIPVAGRIVWSAAAALVTLTSAFILGRLRARVAHLFTD